MPEDEPKYNSYCMNAKADWNFHGAQVYLKFTFYLYGHSDHYS